MDFKFGDIILGDGNRYLITNSSNPCVVTITSDIAGYFEFSFKKNQIRVSPLIYNKSCTYSLSSEYVKKVPTVNEKNGIKKGNIVQLKDICNKKFNIPHNLKGEVINIIDDTTIENKFGEIVLFFSKIGRYEIVDRNMIKAIDNTIKI